MATVEYQEGNQLSSSANWMRHLRVVVYIHNQAQIIYPNTASAAATAAATSFASQQEGDVKIDVSDLGISGGSNLRCVFSAQHYALNYPNLLNLAIYNLDALTETDIIEEGYRITVEAGYGTAPGQIFDGTVVMCTRSKINGVDEVLNILAMDGAEFYIAGFADFAILKGQSALDVINKVASAGTVQIPIGYTSPVLSTTKLAKGQLIHGTAKQTLDDYAKSINGTWFVEGGKLYVIAYADTAATLPMGKQVIGLNPLTGLLGNPQQQSQGMTCRSLMNPAIQIYGFVHVSNVLITEQMVQVGSYSQGISQKYALDPEGIYRVISVNHNGDTRDNSWYSDITTVTQQGLTPEMLTISDGTASMN